MEMEQTAEGYYGAKCIHDVNRRYHVDMPILEAVYEMLYRRLSPSKALAAMSRDFT